MTLTPKQVTTAYRAVTELSNIVLPYRAARAVAALKKRLAEENDTVAAAEKNLVKEYGGQVSPGGHCDFPDDDAAQRFNGAREAFLEQEDEIKLPAVDLSKHTSLIRITPAAIEALEGIVIFERPEEESADA